MPSATFLDTYRGTVDTSYTKLATDTPLLIALGFNLQRPFCKTEDVAAYTRWENVYSFDSEQLKLIAQNLERESDIDTVRGLADGGTHSIEMFIECQPFNIEFKNINGSIFMYVISYEDEWVCVE